MISKLFFLVGIIVCSASCETYKEPLKEKPTPDEDSTVYGNSTVYGTWQLVASSTDIVPSDSAGFDYVEDGFKMTINEDGSFTSTEFAECTEGRFQTTNDTITFIYGCENFTAHGRGNPKDTLSYRYSMVNGKLKLAPSNFLCYGGCVNLFAKIDETIYGTWQLVASATDALPADSAGFDYVEDGFKITINEDGSFTSTEFAECTEGRFQTTNDTVTFIYGCENFAVKRGENPKGTLPYRYRMVNGKLELVAIDLVCYGGCVDLFARIDE